MQSTYRITGRVTMIVDSKLTIGFDELSPGEWKSLLNKLTFELDGDVVRCYRRLLTKGCYVLPRGAWNLLPDHVVYHDRRVYPKMPKLLFTVTLDDVEKDERFHGQLDAVKSMFEH